MSKLSTSIILAAVLAISATSANAAVILFGRVGSGSYVADGQQLVNYLTAGGHTVNYVDLNAGVISDFSSYSQVWVYDLVSTVDKSATQLANYANISNWYNTLVPNKQNLITDGRIISSSALWTDRSDGLGTGGEPVWIQSYANLLALGGGGLVLGTDHDAFHSGINEINTGIGINLFNGFYYTPPLEAFVDSASPLFVGGLEPCTFALSESCINDNSSTGFVPTGLQPNGQFLTPVAYHGSVSEAYNLAAVSTTFGSRTFGTCGEVGQPPCINDVPEPSMIALMLAGLFGLGFARRRMRS